MKKLLLVLMLVAIAAFAFGKETLVVVSRLWTPPSEKEFVINEILKPFEEMYGVEVKFSTLDDQKILEQVKLQQETGNITTDVIIAYAANMPEWVDNGYVVDLTDVVSQWTDRHFSKGLDSMTVFNGKGISFLSERMFTSLLPTKRLFHTFRKVQIFRTSHGNR